MDWLVRRFLVAAAVLLAGAAVLLVRRGVGLRRDASP